MRWHHYALATPLAPGATTDLALRPRVRRARLSQRRRRPGRARQRHVPQSGPHARDVADPELRLRRRRASSPSDSDRRKFGLAPQAAHARPRRPGVAPAERAVARRRLHRLSRAGVHGRRPAAGHLRLRRARLDRERPPLHRLPDGLADGRDLSVRVRALRGQARRVERARTATSRSRSTTTPATSTTSTGWSPASRIRSTYFTQHFGPYQHRILRIIEFPRFSRSGGFAESFPNTRAVQRGDRLHRQGRRPRSQGHRLSVLRDRARGRAPVVGAPGSAGERAGRRVHHREPRRILGADGAEAQVRRREDAPLPASTSSTATCRAAAPSRRASSRCCAPTARRTCTTRRARWRCTRCRTRSARPRWTTRCRRSSKRWRFKGPPYATSRDLSPSCGA